MAAPSVPRGEPDSCTSPAPVLRSALLASKLKSRGRPHGSWEVSRPPAFAITVRTSDGAIGLSGEPGSLLVPAERQLADPLQLLGRQLGRLGAVEDALDDIGREKGELQ